MALKDYLTLLTFVGLFIGLIAGVISQIAKTSETVDGSNIKRLTTAGKLALGISLIGFVGSFSSELLKASITAAQKQADAAEAERRVERQQSEDEWRKRSEQLLNTAVSKADENLRHVIEGFKAEQLAILNARLELLNDNLIRETRLYGRLSATSTPLTKLTIRLVVKDVPEEVRTKLQKAIQTAKERPNAPDFQDLNEHHDVDDEDERALVRSEMDRLAIQPFIAWLATGAFELKQGILLVGLGDHFSAIACIGWIDSPDFFDPTYRADDKKKIGKKNKTEKKVTKLPSGVVVGKEIEWKPSYEKDTRDYEREKKTRPATTIAVSDNSVILAIDFDHLALSDALLRYAPNSMTNASLPDRLIFVAWSPSQTGDIDSAFPLVALPFNSTKIGESLSGLNSRKVTFKERPQWENVITFELIPNGVIEIAKEYGLRAVAEEELMEGPRADESHGYVRIWHGQSP
jgi:hypothetical protein